MVMRHESSTGMTNCFHQPFGFLNKYKKLKPPFSRAEQYRRTGGVVNYLFSLCSSKVNLSGANGNVIMSGWEDDNPDNARRETIRRNPTSVSKRADSGASRTSDGGQRTAVLPD